MEITSNGTLSATRGYGIWSTGDDLVLVNAGTISARKDAIRADGDDASISSTDILKSSHGAGISASGEGVAIHITTTVKAATFGILASGDLAEITNEGIIKSAGIGIQSTGDGSVVDTTARLIGNVALVLGGDDSIATNANLLRGTSKTEAAVKLSGDADFTNTGAVHAKSGQAIAADAGDNAVTNSGSLHGDVRLGGGDDVFMSRVGAVDGKVYGGKGDDVYVVGIELDIVEKPGQGIDTVKALFSWTLGANIENLTLIGKAAADARGNNLANVLTGNAGDNRFWGYGGRDIFVMTTDGGTDQIMDFQDGRDRIDFGDVAGIARFADLRPHMAQSGRDVVIDLLDEPGETMLIIRKTDLADLTARDFLF